MAPLTLAMVVIRGFTFQPLVGHICGVCVQWLVWGICHAICEFYELECDGWGGGFGWGLLLHLGCPLLILRGIGMVGRCKCILVSILKL